MKPKHRIFCPDCQRQKMQFESEKEAELFIKYNSNDMKKKPSRVYYCPLCCCYHITSHTNNREYIKREQRKLDLIETQKRQKETLRLEMSVHSADTDKLMREVRRRFESLTNRYLIQEYKLTRRELQDFLNYVTDIRKNNLYLGRNSKKNLSKMRLSIEEKLNKMIYEEQKAS